VTRRQVLRTAVTYTGVAGLAATVTELAEYLKWRLATPRKARFEAIQPVPGQILDLSIWKVSLPTSGHFTEITQPALATHSDPDFRAVCAVQFTAPVAGSIQPGSNYPRSELREMNRDGSPASWSTAAGRHTMEITQRITHLPRVKPELVAGQIHDSKEYVILIWLSRTRLSVMYAGSSIGVLDPHYDLGTVFALKIVAADGFIEVYYNGALKVRQADNRPSCYFKAGCYTQSNLRRGDSPQDFGQVEILSLSVAHQP